jgi:hypothetical protein
LDNLGPDLGDGAAAAADEVHMPGILRDVVGGRAVAEVRVGHQGEFLEKVERAVHGGHVHAAGDLAHVIDDLFGGGVPKCRDGLEHELALRGEPITLRPQPALPLGAARRRTVRTPLGHRVSLGPASANPSRLVLQQFFARRAGRVNQIPQQGERQAMRQ